MCVYFDFGTEPVIGEMIEPGFVVVVVLCMFREPQRNQTETLSFDVSFSRISLRFVKNSEFIIKFLMQLAFN